MSSRYIVVFKDTATPAEVNQYANEVANNGGTVFHRYDAVLNGFSAAIPDHFLSFLQASDIIEYIEPDGIVTTQ